MKIVHEIEHNLNYHSNFIDTVLRHNIHSAILKCECQQKFFVSKNQQFNKSENVGLVLFSSDFERSILITYFKDCFDTKIFKICILKLITPVNVVPWSSQWYILLIGWVQRVYQVMPAICDTSQKTS